ncbi:MAG TPA: signal peptidase I [Solirubrobacteraceae bacterium]|nr:signal peptidase I [Solirubrobacteraceae bacterium]
MDRRDSHKINPAGRQKSHPQVGWRRAHITITTAAVLIVLGLGACGDAGHVQTKAADAGAGGSVASGATPSAAGTPSGATGATAKKPLGAAAGGDTASRAGTPTGAGAASVDGAHAAPSATGSTGTDGAAGKGRGATQQRGRRSHRAARRPGNRSSTQSSSAETGSASSSGRSAGSGSSSTDHEAGVPYLVSTNSMLPTFKAQSTVHYDPTRTHPAVGDVIAFYYPVGVKDGSCGNNPLPQQACRDPAPGLTRQIGIKRVVGLPGDTIAFRDGETIRNGQAASEPVTLPCGTGPGCEYQRPLTVPAGHFYVLSDNRELYFQDSRVWGSVPQEAIVGTVVESSR